MKRGNMEVRILALVAAAALALVACRNVPETPAGPAVATCQVTINGQNVTVTGPICGDGNTTNTNPPASPSPSPTPGCVAQTGTFVCAAGGPIFEAALLETQRSVPAAPQPSYIVALVEALNKRTDVCAIAGPASDEVTIKARNSNALSATWDVVNADGTIQAIQAKPSPICQPSRF